MSIDINILYIEDKILSLYADKSNLTNDGKIKTKHLRQIARAIYLKNKSLSKEKLNLIVQYILNSESEYRCTIAFDILFRARNLFSGEEDKELMFDIIDKHISNWVLCDDFCTHSFYYWLKLNGNEIASVIQLTSSPNASIRRASVVSFIKFAQQGLYLNNSLRVVENLFDDKDYLVQKSIGWLIKEHFKFDQSNQSLILWCKEYELSLSPIAKSYFGFSKLLLKWD